MTRHLTLHCTLVARINCSITIVANQRIRKDFFFCVCHGMCEEDFDTRTCECNCEQKKLLNWLFFQSNLSAKIRTLADNIRPRPNLFIRFKTANRFHSLLIMRRQSTALIAIHMSQSSCTLYIVQTQYSHLKKIVVNCCIMNSSLVIKH